MDPVIKEAGAKVTTRGELPAAYGYAPWVEEIWVNYLSNAIKYGAAAEAQLARMILPNAVFSAMTRDYLNPN